MSTPKAVVLLSGGLDSATTAAIARSEGYEVYALSVDYGQRHRFELESAERVAAAVGVAAMAAHVAPAMNIQMADRTGVGMIVAGRAPLRDPDSKSQGRIPAPGWLSDNDWRGFLPYEEMPRVLRPASGAVGNANNRTASGAFPRHVSFHWGDPYRIRRLDKQLAAREFHTLDSASALQNDAVSEMARAVLPLIARDLWWTGPAAPADRAAALRQDALQRLADWNGEMSEHAPEPLIFAEWMRRLTERLAGDELGPALARVEGPNPVFVERVFRNVQGAGVWCDIDNERGTSVVVSYVGRRRSESGGARGSLARAVK